MISSSDLNVLIRSLQEYKAQGVSDPWVLSDGTKIEPLDALLELKELRGGSAKILKEITPALDDFSKSANLLIKAGFEGTGKEIHENVGFIKSKLSNI